MVRNSPKVSEGRGSKCSLVIKSVGFWIFRRSRSFSSFIILDKISAFLLSLKGFQIRVLCFVWEIATLAPHRRKNSDFCTENWSNFRLKNFENQPRLQSGVVFPFQFFLLVFLFSNEFLPRLRIAPSGDIFPLIQNLEIFQFLDLPVVSVEELRYYLDFVLMDFSKWCSIKFSPQPIGWAQANWL